MRVRRLCMIMCIAMPLGMLCAGSVLRADEAMSSAKTMYEHQCASCHGGQGEGLDDAGTGPFEGDQSVADLVRIIDETMPEDDPDLCRGADAEAVAQYVFQTFYAGQAEARLNAARIELSRLTVRQYEHAVTDLLATFLGEAKQEGEPGLQAAYYKAKSFSGKNRVFERIDPRVVFNFGEQSPESEKIGVEEFAIQWQGSVLADETGDYEFCVTTENGVKLWVNDQEQPLIDAWVASGGKQNHRATVRLLGGRVYPLRLDFFKFKIKTASIELSWVPPHRAQEPIPVRNLTTKRVPSSFVVNSVFPADDSSVGYERGTTVSKAWDSAVASAAVEVANFVVQNLDRLAGTKEGSPDRVERIQKFCHRFAERAFRRTLTEELRERYVDSFFAEGGDAAKAAKRVVLFVLQSPRFLYLGIDNTKLDDYQVASRMSFGMWDSLPDRKLLEAARSGKLHTREEVAREAERMLEDPRTRVKLRTFLHSWLNIEHVDDLAKDPDRYHGFDASVASSLRTSLDLFLDEVLWHQEGDFRELLLADFWFVNQAVAKYYEIDCSSDASFEKVAGDPAKSAGILTHPYLMARFAYHKTSSPIHRGVFIVRSLLGRFLKPPPIAVAPADEGDDPNLTTRQRVAKQTSEPTCQTCHSMINALGFSFEHYDAVGKYRALEQQKQVDASGSYRDLAGNLVTFNGVRELAEFLANSEETHLCFVRQLFHNIAKQPVAAYGTETMDQLVGSFAESDFNVQKLLVAIVTTSALGTNKE